MIILRDTREQTPWGFEWFKCEVEVATIKYGDYTIKGLEDKIRIERKASTGEIFNNLCTKTGYARFRREMAELNKIESAFILCEFPQLYMQTFPENSGIPKTRRVKGKVIDNTPKVSSKFLRKRSYEIEEDFDIKIIYCDTPQKAEETAFNILLGVYNEYGGTNGED